MIAAAAAASAAAAAWWWSSRRGRGDGDGNGEKKTLNPLASLLNSFLKTRCSTVDIEQCVWSSLLLSLSRRWRGERPHTHTNTAIFIKSRMEKEEDAEGGGGGGGRKRVAEAWDGLEGDDFRLFQRATAAAVYYKGEGKIQPTDTPTQAEAKADNGVHHYHHHHYEYRPKWQLCVASSFSPSSSFLWRDNQVASIWCAPAVRSLNGYTS